MAINVNPPNFSALAALAGTRVGNLGLPYAGVDSPLGAAANAFNQARGQTLDQQNKEAALAQQGAQFNATLGMDQAKLAEQARQFDVSAQLEKDKAMQIQLKNDFDAQLKLKTQMDDEELNKRGALAAGYIASYSQTNDPEEQLKIKDEFLNMAHKQRLLTDEQFTLHDQMTPKQLYQSSILDLMVTNKASGLKDLMGGKFGEGPLSTDRQPTSAETTNASQKDISSALGTIDRMKKVGDEYSKDYLTYAGKVRSNYGSVVSALPQGVQDVLPDAEESQKFTEKQKAFGSQLDQLLAQYVKAMSGVQYGMKELQMHKDSIINSDDTPATFKGKYNMMLDIMKRSINLKQDLLKEGVPINSDQFNKRYEKEIGPLINKISNTTEISDEPNSYTFKGQTYTSDDIDETAKHYGISREEVLKQLGGQ